MMSSQGFLSAWVCMLCLRRLRLRFARRSHHERREGGQSSWPRQGTSPGPKQDSQTCNPWEMKHIRIMIFIVIAASARQHSLLRLPHLPCLPSPVQARPHIPAHSHSLVLTDPIPSTQASSVCTSSHILHLSHPPISRYSRFAQPCVHAGRPSYPSAQ